MGIIRNLLDGRAVRNAVQQQKGFNSYGDVSYYTRNIDYNSFFDGLNKSGKYDNFYGDENRITSVASKYPIYYVKNNKVVDKGDFVQYLEHPNDDYPQAKVLQQIYTEMITRGYTELFLWRKDGKKETSIFELNKRYGEDTFRGITLVSGYDNARLTRAERDSIVKINFGASQANVFVGYSPSQAAAAWVKMQDEMGLHMTAFARNAGMPIGKFIITAPSPEEYAKMREKLEDKISGARNNGKILYDYRPADSKVTQIEWVQFTSQDVQDYTKQLEFSEKKMSQSFGVPGTIKGTNDGENYATARVSEQIFIKYTVKTIIEDFLTQFEHKMGQRFDLKGELKVNVPIPEIADESLVKIRATTAQVALFDKKRAEGYTAESIVAAYELPESFLLLEKEKDTSDPQNKPKKATKNAGSQHNHVHNDLERRYQNSLTKEEREDIESKFRAATKSYSDAIIESGINDVLREEYEGRMAVVFTEQYAKLYNKTVDEVADALAETLEVVDVADLNLTDEELESAVKKYGERVAQFAVTFADGIEQLPGKTLEVRKRNAQSNIDRVVVTESEHTRIVSELGAWTKAQEDFPVRVYKTWNTMPGACKECVDLENIEIDVTALFVNRTDDRIDEIYEVQGGGLHPNCQCFVTYTMEGEEVRKKG